MDELVSRISDWPQVLRWAVQGLSRDSQKSDEVILIDSIADLLDKKITKSPRIPACASAMQEVQQHFGANRDLDKPTLALYQSILRVQSRSDVFAFLVSVLEGTVDELFESVPTELISCIKGRPCRIRDTTIHENDVKPLLNEFSRIPVLLLGDENGVHLMIRGKVLASLNISSDFLAVIPTENRLEQLSIACNPRGLATLLSTTRKSLASIGTFQLDVPEGGTIDWLECREWRGVPVLYWGGTDHLRGTCTWSYFSGLQTEKDDIFCEVADAEEAWKDQGFDFTKHGNTLTLCSQVIDVESKDVRTWKEEQQILSNSTKLCDANQVSCVWGLPQQYILLDHDGRVEVWLHGEKVSGFQAQKAKSACVLFSHSR